MSGTDLLVMRLVLLGIVAAWVAEVLPIENGFTGRNDAGAYVLIPVKTIYYYAADALAIASLFTAGICAGLKKNFRNVAPEARLAFPVLIVTAAIWACVAYSSDEMLSSKILGATGPFVWFMLVVVFAGAGRHIWTYIDPLIRILAYLTAALAFWTLATEPYIYFLGFSKYILFAMLLLWLGGWTLLTATRLQGWRLLVRLIPYATMLLMALCSQSRSWTLLGLILGAMFVYLRSRERGSFVSGMRMAMGLGVAAVLLTIVVSMAFPDALNKSVEGFESRLYQDTRTGQYEAFFAAVPVTDLLLGRGPKGTWYGFGWGEYQFFDNGYLWTLFIGGVPTLICLAIIAIWPGIKAIRCNPGGDDAAAVCLVLLQGLALSGLSTFTLPTVTLPSYLCALYAGRCHLLLMESSRRQQMDRVRANARFAGGLILGRPRPKRTEVPVKDYHEYYTR